MSKPQIHSNLFFPPFLNLSGRLGQIGLKEGYISAVKNISSVIALFVHHAKEEGNVYLEKLQHKICNVNFCQYKQNTQIRSRMPKQPALCSFMLVWKRTNRFQFESLALPKLTKPVYYFQAGNNSEVVSANLKLCCFT